MLPDLHRCHVLRNQMFHFVSQLQYYVYFEVIESAWQEFAEGLPKANDLDHLIASHQNYLNVIFRKIFMTDTSQAIHENLRRSLDLTIRLQHLQVQEKKLAFHILWQTKKKKPSLSRLGKKKKASLFDVYFREVERRQALLSKARDRTEQGSWGLTEEEPSVRETSRSHAEEFSQLYQKVSTLQREYKVRCLLLFFFLSSPVFTFLPFVERDWQALRSPLGER